MTPEQYELARRKLVRYGQSFDMSVNMRLPQPVVKTKAGKVAKRQPHYDQQPKGYYQAQCSFRGLQTSGTKEELEQLLLHRDIGKDFHIQRELNQLQQNMTIYEHEQEVAHRDKWWNDPTTHFEDKLEENPQRALQEEIDRPGSDMLRSCRIFQGYWYELSRATRNLGLAYELVQGPLDLPPGGDVQQWQIVGNVAVVSREARRLEELAKQKALELWSSWQAKVEAENAVKQKQRQAFVAEAKAMDNWDITGKWIVHCKDIAEFRREPPETLHMEIFKDNYRLDAVCDDEVDPDSEDEYSREERRAQSIPIPESAAISRLPRFCARFSFGVMEGIMRIYPGDSAQVSRPWTSVKDNPTFEYRWRGRETGEGEIQNEARDYVRNMTFSDFGTRFEGLFDCPCIDRGLKITGTKTAHGRGETLSSAPEWRGLNESAWDEECGSRWH